MHDLRDREDVIVLVNTFYSKVRAHEELGPFFDEYVKIDWDKHLPTMYDFWETNLFFVSKYKGNPVKTHQDVDQKATIEQKHFGFWLQLWFMTIDELFQGEKANLLKSRARNMSHMLFMRIFTARENR